MNEQKKAKEHRLHAKRSAQCKLKPAKLLTSKIEVVHNPMALAIRTARSFGYSRLYNHYRDDVGQELALTLIRLGVRELEKPVSLDVKELSRKVNRSLERLTSEITWTRANSYAKVLSGESLEYACSQLAKSWSAAWRNA